MNTSGPSQVVKRNSKTEKRFASNISQLRQLFPQQFSEPSSRAIATASRSLAASAAQTLPVITANRDCSHCAALALSSNNEDDIVWCVARSHFW
jgi:hypothetical protein